METYFMFIDKKDSILPVLPNLIYRFNKSQLKS